MRIRYSIPEIALDGPIRVYRTRLMNNNVNLPAQSLYEIFTEILLLLIRNTKMIKRLLFAVALSIGLIPASYAADVYRDCANLVTDYAYFRDRFDAAEFSNLFTDLRIHF